MTLPETLEESQQWSSITETFDEPSRLGEDNLKWLTTKKFLGPYYNNTYSYYLGTEAVWITNPSCDGKNFIWNDLDGNAFKMIATAEGSIDNSNSRDWTGKNLKFDTSEITESHPIAKYGGTDAYKAIISESGGVVKLRSPWYTRDRYYEVSDNFPRPFDHKTDSCQKN